MRGLLSRGRYAPSPSGAMHLGNLRTALLAWLFARSASGTFLLRVEDLDHPRVRPGAASAMLRDLHWLGLDWDEGPGVGGAFGPYTQSQRLALYDSALSRLRAAGAVYPCYCTRAELSAVASAPHPGEEGARYPGTCRQLSSAKRRAREREGRSPAWRFRVPDREVVFRDQIAGEVRARPAESTGDFIVRRADGLHAYQLAVVVDDALMAVTQVVRGADLLDSTPRQLLLYDALGYPRPREYAHVPLLRDESGARLSKRDIASGVAPLRERGISSAMVVGMLAASCGLTSTAEPVSAAELVDSFSAHAVGDFQGLALPAPWRS